MTLSQGIGPYRVQVGPGLPYANRPGDRRVRKVRCPRVSVCTYMHIIIHSIYLIRVVVGFPADRDGPDLLLSKPTKVCVVCTAVLPSTPSRRSTVCMSRSGPALVV